MHAFRPAALIAATFAFSLAACGRTAPAPETPAPLTRPVVLLDIRNAGTKIPAALIVERNGLPGVFVLNSDGVARFRLVRAGYRGDGRIDIVSGLTGTETLVAGDLTVIHDGSVITPIK